MPVAAVASVNPAHRAGRSLIATALIVLLVAGLMSLGIWQLRRADEKAAAQVARDAALAAAPVRPDAAASAAALDGRRVELVGRFEPKGTVLLDNRTHRGVAGFHVLTPMALEDSRTRVMVLRGWVARDPLDRTRLPEVRTPEGTLRIEGLAMAELPQPIVLAREPVPVGEASPIRQHFDLAEWQRQSGPTSLPLVVRQTSTLDDALVREWTLPGSGVDKHRAYAFQWFAMAAAAAWLGWRLVGRARRVAGGPVPD